MVKITPIESLEKQSDVWEKYYKYTKTNGPILDEIVLPSRNVNQIKNIPELRVED
ncbi:MAG: hypothetical protein KAQ69_02075 [Spirochaetales bacterium]|nr:hypothetical protein [Spirochaetales bacterium]